MVFVKGLGGERGFRALAYVFSACQPAVHYEVLFPVNSVYAGSFTGSLPEVLPEVFPYSFFYISSFPVKKVK